LVELAAGCDAPQIVMATRGRKADCALMPAAAEAVLRQAPCPVVMVNDEDLAAVRPTGSSVHQYARAAS
jgi:nucleotide-binding universal stress UspA family protein